MMVSIQKRININVHRIWTLNVTPFLRIFEWTLEASQEKVALKGRRQPTRPAPSRGGTFRVSIYDWCVQPGDKNEPKTLWPKTAPRCFQPAFKQWSQVGWCTLCWSKQALTSTKTGWDIPAQRALNNTRSGPTLHIYRPQASHTHTHTPVALLLSTRHARARSTVLIPLLACKHRF